MDHEGLSMMQGSLMKSAKTGNKSENHSQMYLEIFLYTKFVQNIMVEDSGKVTLSYRVQYADMETTWSE